MAISAEFDRGLNNGGKYGEDRLMRVLIDYRA